MSRIWTRRPRQKIKGGKLEDELPVVKRDSSRTRSSSRSRSRRPIKGALGS